MCAKFVQFYIKNLTKVSYVSVILTIIITAELTLTPGAGGVGYGVVGSGPW